MGGNEGHIPTAPAQMTGASTRASAPRRSGGPGGFYLYLSGAVLLSVVVAFSPTFFLRPFFTDRPLPFYLHVHGAVLTLWFSLVFVQACLVSAHRVRLHRRLGIAGAVNAAILVPLSAFVAVRAIPRMASAGVAPSEIEFIVLGDLLSLGVFSCLVGTALVWRRYPEWHRRLMMVASIMILGPAIARLERVGFAVPVPAVLLGMLAAVGISDVVRLGRLHRATVAGALAVVLALVALLLLMRTGTGQVVIERLSHW